MENELITFFMTQGPFAGLFVWLLYTTKKEGKERENQLHALLSKFSEKYDLIIDKIDKLENKLKG
ncbi:BhlA/UviB family holin-like peptide [Chengkuizengella sp. SCS-71B]|uniref:BhlA/UviB family holin-like peptide n=1 Tax=Chengkuizengella sp. SCS-71B TaxID=3115290 RepID=UPI0032C22E53